jgi:hypothetical protein
MFNLLDPLGLPMAIIVSMPAQLVFTLGTYCQDVPYRRLSFFKFEGDVKPVESVLPNGESEGPLMFLNCIQELAASVIIALFQEEYIQQLRVHGNEIGHTVGTCPFLKLFAVPIGARLIDFERWR